MAAWTNRCRYPLEVLTALRAVVALAARRQKPLSVRISAHDWLPMEIPPTTPLPSRACSGRVARMPLIDVSSGQTTTRLAPGVRPHVPHCLTPFADRIRNEVGIATMAVPQARSPGGPTPTASSPLVSPCRPGEDMCHARPHLADPAWTRCFACRRAIEPVAAARTDWPVQDHPASGRDQMLREISKQKQAAAHQSSASLIKPEASGRE